VTSEALAGVLVVDKPPGVTSFDVVAAVRRALRTRRAGHAGTLDPAATGVLPVLLGEATKLMAYLADQDKEYRVTVRFGVTTDTLDLEGRVLSTAPVTGLTRQAVAHACRPLIGRIAQAPPMYSAVHHEGQRLYELARRGVEVERRPREVVVHAIDVESVEGASAVLRVVCGKGTYVRVLAGDLGAALGFGAAVERLQRTRVGPFALAAAVAMADLTTRPREALVERVLDPAAALTAWEAVTLDEDGRRAFVHGQAVPCAGAAGDAFVRVHDAGGALIGVGRLTGHGAVRPVRILHVDRPGPRVLRA
jgi:tRNA pseudouridine55 synthase